MCLNTDLEVKPSRTCCAPASLTPVVDCTQLERENTGSLVDISICLSRRPSLEDVLHQYRVSSLHSIDEHDHRTHRSDCDLAIAVCTR